MNAVIRDYATWMEILGKPGKETIISLAAAGKSTDTTWQFRWSHKSELWHALSLGESGHWAALMCLCLICSCRDSLQQGVRDSAMPSPCWLSAQPHSFGTYVTLWWVCATGTLSVMYFFHLFWICAPGVGMSPHRICKEIQKGGTFHLFSVRLFKFLDTTTLLFPTTFFAMSLWILECSIDIWNVICWSKCICAGLIYVSVLTCNLSGVSVSVCVSLHACVILLSTLSLKSNLSPKHDWTPSNSSNSKFNEPPRLICPANNSMI